MFIHYLIPAPAPVKESIKHASVKESIEKNVNIHFCVHFHSEQRSSRYSCLKSLHRFDFWTPQLKSTEKWQEIGTQKICNAQFSSTP